MNVSNKRCYGMESRSKRILRLAEQETMSALSAHCFRTDALGIWSTMADRLVAETTEAAVGLGLTEAEHDFEVARMLCWDTAQFWQS